MVLTMIRSVGGNTVPNIAGFEFVFDANGFDGKANNTIAVLARMIGEFDIDVIEEIGSLGGQVDSSHGKATGIVQHGFTTSRM